MEPRPDIRAGTGRRARLIISGGAVLIASAYLAVRAVWVPFSYDEAVAYFRYIDADPAAVFDFEIAGNHLLNTFLSRMTSVLDTAPWALRLPNVLAGVGYLAAGVMLSRLTRHPAIGTAGLILLATNPYVLDYFALSRGYGLMVALLTGSLAALLAWLERPVDSSASGRALAWCVGLGAAAVAANFSALTAFVAIVGVIALRLAGSAVHGAKRRPIVVPGPMWSPRILVIWLLATAVFSGLVLARDRAIAQPLFTPITVRVVGVFPEEAEQIRVFRTDPTGRVIALSRTGTHEWESGPRRDIRGLRVAMPTAVDRNLTSLEVTIGDHVFRRDRRSAGPWHVLEEAGERLLVSTDRLRVSRSLNPAMTPAINWEADRRHARTVLRYAAAAAAAWLALAAALTVAALVCVRYGLVTKAEARTVAAGMLGVASVAAVPLYLLQSENQLYLGGSSGLVGDTFGSLVHGTLYGAAYDLELASPALFALGAVAVTALAAVLVVLIARRDSAFVRPAALLGFLMLAAALIVVQHRLIGTPYPMGRTALFLVPALLILPTAFADAAAGLGRIARVASIAIMCALAAGSVLHLARVANLSFVFDWPGDQSTERMLRAVEQAVAAEGGAAGVVRVGVERSYYPVALYYAGQFSREGSRYEIAVLPGDGPAPAFQFTRRTAVPAHASVVAEFPESGTAVWR